MKNFLILLSFVAILFACDNDTTVDTMIDDTATIWDGPTTTFSKAAEADPTLAENQDRLTARVQLTRGNDGGQIYNAATEDSADKTNSPAGTLWAIGTLEERENLTFEAFRAAVGSPKDVVGKDLVLRLVDDNIFVAVKFTEWAQRKGGGFTYERSTEN
ncbi:MAG: hypothetical protein AAGI23_01885 [Bacteroidota bacterium]